MAHLTKKEEAKKEVKEARAEKEAEGKNAIGEPMIDESQFHTENK